MNPSHKAKSILGNRKPRKPPRSGGRAGAGVEAAPVIPAERIHPNVLEIVKRLGERGFTALLVGGAVRDLLLGRAPKDFDLATAARPEQVKRLFSNARIIGRRFRLVHLKYPDMTVEVATFRAASSSRRGGMIVRDNTYGTPEEDAFRRDFTVNALTCELPDGRVIDHVGGLADLREGVIRTIAPPHVSLREDPVRMLRAVRFMVRLGFHLEGELAGAMTGMADGLARVKRHRLAEETQRFLTKGNALEVFAALEPFGLLAPMLGLDGQTWFFAPQARKAPLTALKPYLKALDAWLAAGREPPSAALALLGLVLACARPEQRELLLWPGAAHPSRRGKPPAGLNKLKVELHQMLGNWGLLKGQVNPAMLILSAARTLLAGRRPHSAGLPPRGEGRPPPGTREAWQLLALLGAVLGLEKDFTSRAPAEMAGLPVLPIFDHQPRRPEGRKRADAARPGGGRPRGRGRSGGTSRGKQPQRSRRHPGRHGERKPAVS